jgi:hypothetical protein
LPAKPTRTQWKKENEIELRKASLRDQRETKEELVLAYASTEKLANLLLTLGFFKETRLQLTCPKLDRLTPRESCGAKQHWQPCAWSSERVGKNHDCPLDAELRQALEETDREGIKGILRKNINFTLQRIRGNHAVDIAVEFSHGRSIQVNDFFALTHTSPSEYFIIFDLELVSALRAIRFIRLLSSDYSSDAIKPQPILVTLNTDQKLRETIEGQGIKVYSPR